MRPWKGVSTSRDIAADPDSIKHRGRVREVQDGECLMYLCRRPAALGEELCSHHLKFYRFYCRECGHFIRSEVTMDRTGGDLCLPCWNKTDEGRAWRVKVANANRRANKENGDAK